MASSCEARRSKLREPLFVVGAVFCVGYGGRAGRMVSWRYPEPASGFWGPWCVASALLARPTQQAHTEGTADELRRCEFTQRRHTGSRFCENDASVKLRLRVMAPDDSPRILTLHVHSPLLGVVGLSWFGRGARVRFAVGVRVRAGNGLLGNLPSDTPSPTSSTRQRKVNTQAT